MVYFRYKLFKKYNILSKRILKEDIVREARPARSELSEGEAEAESSSRMRRRKKKAALVTYVVGPSNKSTTNRIQEPSANQVTLANVPTARPIYQFRGEAVPISDLDSEGNPPNSRGFRDKGHF